MQNRWKHQRSSACRNHMTVTQKSQPRSRHDVQDATATAVIASKGRTATAATITATATARPCTTATARHTTDMVRTSRHDHRDDVTTHAIALNNDHARANITRHAKTQPNKRSNVAPRNKHPRGGVSPPGAKSKAAGSLVLTLNARWNIFGLPVTYEVFTYLVVATVSAPYILCIMFLGLMLMVVERSSGPHRYLAAITHCA